MQYYTYNNGVNLTPTSVTENTTPKFTR